MWFQIIFLKLSDWQNLPKDKPLLSVYASVFGQEAFWMDFSGEFIQSIIKVFPALPLEQHMNQF